MKASPPPSVSLVFAGLDLPASPAVEALGRADDALLSDSGAAVRHAQEAARLAGDDRRVAAFAFAYEGIGRSMGADAEAAVALLTQALAELEPLGDLAGRSLVLSALAGVQMGLGQYDAALTASHETLALTQALGDPEREAWARVGIGNASLELDDPDEALGHGQRALRLFAQGEIASGQARAHTIVGGALRALGRTREAHAHLDAALQLAREEHNVLTEARALDDLGRLAATCDDLPRALDLHRQALALRTEVGNAQAQATSHLQVAETLTALDEPDAAVAELALALEHAEASGSEPRVADAHRALADAHEAAGRPTEALAHLREFLRRRERLLSAQARSQIHALQVRAEADRARQEAEIARVRSTELGAANAALSDTVTRLERTQGRLVQAEKLASLGRLSAGLAHEIQNPLNFIGNFAELNADLAREVAQDLADGARPEGLKADLDLLAQNAERVREHARRASGIVRSLLGHVRTVGGERRVVPLHSLLDAAVGAVLADTTDVEVVRDFDEGVGDVEAEPGSLQRVLINLVENAVYALRQPRPGRDGRPTLTLVTRAGSDAVELRVVDDGPGIAPADCVRVFEPFFTTKPAGEGTGLGLSLAYDIVTEGHGGTLAAYSRLGEGATFVVTLPVPPSEAPTAPQR